MPCIVGLFQIARYCLLLSLFLHEILSSSRGLYISFSFLSSSRGFFISLSRLDVKTGPTNPQD
jgi:hypothetical protein